MNALTPSATSPASVSLAEGLRTLCDDALFAIATTGRAEPDELGALARRREAFTTSAARGHTVPRPVDGEPWILGLCYAASTVALPLLMPLREAIEDGLSLEGAPRGLRSLFSSKPSEKDLARAREAATLASRTLAGVLSADGQLLPESSLVVAMMLAAMGLPSDDIQRLRAEAPVDPEQLPITGDTERKLARSLVRGAFVAAMGDGMSPAEEKAVASVARKAGMTTDDTSALRAEADAVVTWSREYGEALVDGVRYVLQGASSDPTRERQTLGALVATLALPVGFRRGALEAARAGEEVVLGRKHRELGRKERRAVLAAAWLVCMRTDPRTSERAALATRHDAVALDLADLDEANEARALVDAFLERELGALHRAHARG
jgi:hypothetical protein